MGIVGLAMRPGCLTVVLEAGERELCFASAEIRWLTLVPAKRALFPLHHCYAAGAATLFDLLDVELQHIEAKHSLSITQSAPYGDFAAIQKVFGLGWHSGKRGRVEARFSC